MSSSDDAAKQLAAVQDRNTQRLKQQGNGKVQLAFARDVKNSLLFQYDWGQLLSAAPLALSLMGSCYVAATSPLAREVTLEDAKPANGFKYIHHPELKACLVQVSDAGRWAFLTAEKRMGSINSTSGALRTYMNKIIDYLPLLPDRGAEAALRLNLDNLQASSNSCLEYAKEIEDKFKEWLALVCELHEVTQAKEGLTGQAQQQNESKIAGLNLEAKLTGDTLAHANKVAQEMKSQMDTSKDLFKTAADAVPGPWEVVGLTLVNSLADSVTSVVAQNLPKMMMAGVAGLTGVPPGAAAGLMATVPNDPPANPGNPGNPGNPSNKNNKKGTKKTAAELAQPKTLPDDSTDVAYTTSLKVVSLFTALATLLCVGKKEIDWSALSGSSTDDKSDTQNLTFLRVTLKHQLDYVKWSDRPPSKELKSAMEGALELIAKLEAVAKKGNQLKTTKPDPKTVKEWQDKMVKLQATVSKQVTVAQCLPGGAPGSAPMMNAKPSPGSSASLSAQSAALAAAQEKMNVTQAAYISAQENYLKASEQANKVELQLDSIRASLVALEAEKVTMEGIKRILIQCIGTLIQIKAQITNLVRFFSALSAMVEHVVKENVKDFIQQAESAKKLIIANVSLLDVARQDLYTTALMCQAYFSLFSTIATMYTKVSIDHIMPGVTLCDNLSQSVDDPHAISSRVRQLNEFSANSQRAVRELVAAAQREITSTLDERVQLISNDVGMLPPLQPALSSAISTGQRTITAAAAQGLEEYNAPVAVLDEDYSAGVEEI